MTGTPAFRYAEHRPAPALQHWIRNYWWFAVGDDAPPVHHVPPDGCTALVVHLGASVPAMLSGPWLQPLAVPVRPGDRFGGVRFQPGAVGPVLGLDPAALRDRLVPVPAALLPVVQALRDELGAESGVEEMTTVLDRVLVPVITGCDQRDPLVVAAVDRLVARGGELPIANLALELGCSQRTLRRRFGSATGLSPKEFARIRRLVAAVWAVVKGTSTWSAAAHAAGYADQPHLHRDLADFTGLTPRALGKRLRSTQHDDVVP